VVLLVVDEADRRLLTKRIVTYCGERVKTDIGDGTARNGSPSAPCSQQSYDQP